MLLWRARLPLELTASFARQQHANRSKIFFMVTAVAKGGSNFLAAQINQRNCGHDNYHPMARSSVNAPSSPRRPASATLITKNSFGLPVPGHPDALDADDVPEIKSLYKQ